MYDWRLSVGDNLLGVLVEDVELVKAEANLDVIADLEEVNQDIALVFLLGKLPHDIALAHTSGTFYHHGRLAFTLGFPKQQLVVDLSFHHEIKLSFS